jgi:hypothetical protein
LPAAAEPRFPLQGHYQATFTARDLVAAGEAAEAADDTGTWTLTFVGERWTLRQAGGAFGNAIDRGVVVIHGSLAVFTVTSTNGFPHHEALGTLRWRMSGNTLHFSALGRHRTDLPAVLSARPWNRVR